MAFASLESGDDHEALAEINMVPLIDVMLVLLIIFMVTAPLLTHAVKVDLPRAASTANTTPPETVQIAIDGDSRIYWNGAVVDAGGLGTRLAAAATSHPVPELHLRAARTTPYEVVARVMSEAATHGVQRIGFLTDPADPR